MKLSKINFIAVLCFSMLLNFCSKKDTPGGDDKKFPLYEAAHELIEYYVDILNKTPLKEYSDFDDTRKSIGEASKKLKDIKDSSNPTEENIKKVKEIMTSINADTQKVSDYVKNNKTKESYKDKFPGYETKIKQLTSVYETASKEESK